jgi:hypothetical protein
MNTIVVVNSGDNTWLNLIRSLRKADDWNIIGIDVTLSDYHGSEADVRHLIQWHDEDEFIPAVQEISKEHKADLLYVADTDHELLAISHRRDELDVPTLLPSYDDHIRMENKWATWQALHAAGIPVPDTALATDRDVVASMLEKHGTVWLRLMEGCVGMGSVSTHSLDFATAWLDREGGWGTFTVAECLTTHTATLSGLWYDGELVVSQLRERMGWKYPYLAVSGVTGITGAQRTVWDEELHELAVACVRAVSDRPHGAIGVDFTYNSKGQPLPTEVQPARFYSSMHFLAEAGVNFPAYYCDLALNGRGNWSPVINPVRDNLYWVKNIDMAPKLLTENEYFAV